MAPLAVETGRYTQTPLERRLCENCGVTETESHVLLDCPLYNDIRAEFFSHVLDVQPDFTAFSAEDKLTFIFSSREICYFSAKICDSILTLRKTFMYI